MSIIRFSIACLAFFALPTVVRAQDRIIIRGSEKKDVSIDALFEPGKLWSHTPATLEAAWKDKGFKWTSDKMKDRAMIRRENWSFAQVKLTAFSGKLNVEEVNFSMKDGKIADVVIAAWNKGDSAQPELSEKQFMALVESWSAELSSRVAQRFENRGKDTASAGQAERRLWVGTETLAQLEYSGGKEKVRDPFTGREKAGQNFQGEFIRVRLVPKPKSMIGINTSTGGTAVVNRATLAKSVIRESGGDVLIPNVPMVDQGDKGYCAVATAARVLNYYGIPADQHEMAKVAGNEAGGGGTNPEEMEAALRALQGKYHVRFQNLHDLDYNSKKYARFLASYNRAAKRLGKTVLDTDNFIYFMGGLDSEVLREVNGKGPTFDRFMRVVRENIDKGVPVMWALQLGKYPENGEKAKQFGGGHMRLIIGYNLAKGEIIFSDSWGSGHERKRMLAADASAATMALYLLQPEL